MQRRKLSCKLKKSSQNKRRTNFTWTKFSKPGRKWTQRYTLREIKLRHTRRKHKSLRWWKLSFWGSYNPLNKLKEKRSTSWKVPWLMPQCRRRLGLWLRVASSQKEMNRAKKETYEQNEIVLLNKWYCFWNYTTILPLLVLIVS